MKWYEQKDGIISSMRIIVMMSAFVGNVVVLAGAVAVFMGKPEGVGLAGIGAGMASVGSVAKAYQARGEM
jgi:hypothetical protein